MEVTHTSDLPEVTDLLDEEMRIDFEVGVMPSVAGVRIDKRTGSIIDRVNLGYGDAMALAEAIVEAVVIGREQFEMSAQAALTSSEHAAEVLALMRGGEEES